MAALLLREALLDAGCRCRLESIGDLRVNVHAVGDMGDKRGTLGCWSDDFLVEEDEKDFVRCSVGAPDETTSGEDAGRLKELRRLGS